MSRSLSVQLNCPECQSQKFEANVLKDEGVGVIKCLQCGRDYLLLDSADYWFDVIQNQPYPRPSRCGCKGTAFRLRIDYEFRDDGNVRSVDIWSTCTACGKQRRQFDADIDYSPTQHLVDQPLVYCKNPKILYDLRELSFYAKRTDIARVARFLNKEAGCQFTASLNENGEWLARNVDVDEAEQAILKETQSSNRYQWIYASPQPMKVSDTAVGTAQKEEVFWKRREIIRISSPLSILFGSVSAPPLHLYYVRFSNQYVKNERVVTKSKRFRNLTARLVEWLPTEFVTWRGVNCFDNPQEHARAFGNRYRSKAEKKSRRK